LGAIATTTTIYLLTIWLMGSVFSNDIMKEDKLIVASVAWPHSMLVTVGIVLSSVGAGMQSLTGAPRLLAAIANDGVVPFLKPFASASGEEPIRAVWATYVIASLPCLAGNLDFITPFITMFFLLTYASINLSCFILAIMKAPGFRPTWKYFHWSTSLLGFLWCIVLMMVISWYISIICIFFALFIIIYIKTNGASKDWGDALTGLRFQQARDVLLELRRDNVYHAKNWRPQILIIDEFGPSGLENPKLLTVAAQLKKGRGLSIVVGLERGDPRQDAKRLVDAEDELALCMAKEGLLGFHRVAICDNPNHAFYDTVQLCGLGALSPNTVMVGWPEGWKSMMGDEMFFIAETFADRLKCVVAARKALVVVKGLDNFPGKSDHIVGNLDVWWVVHDGGLLLLLPHLLSLHRVWRGSKIRLFCVAHQISSMNDLRDIERKAKVFLEKVRITAEVETIDLSDVQITEKGLTSL